MTKNDILKKNLIASLEKTLGVVTTACQKCECSRETFYRYYREDEEFKKKVDDIENITLDFVESSLHKKINDGDTTAMIFYLKTKGKKRGYVERTEIEQTNVNSNEPLTIKIVDE